jgi:GT2 family glycosyltransferase/glycosyltransferase involved in cell wall biosynthesis
MTIQQDSGQGKQKSEVRSTRKTCPRLSVILCTYNRRNLVLSALASLRRQTLAYDQFEVLVIDNGSTDGTLEAVRAYVNAGRLAGRKPEDSWLVHCLAEAQNGLAYARRKGLELAAGEIAVFVDDDTLADPYFLEGLLKAYTETRADAVGGRVELRWEAPRPYWLTTDMLELLGYFAPVPTRTRLGTGTNFSSCCFSVKIEALQSVGYFSPFLSKRLHVPASMEVHEMCNRLLQAGYALWYEPDAMVSHRVPAARLHKAYFVGRAYWQGRSEVLREDWRNLAREDASWQLVSAAFHKILPEMRQILYLAFIHRPLLRLAERPTAERLEALMAQAKSWGRVQQRLQFLMRVPAEPTPPAVMLVRATQVEPGADLLARGLLSLQGVSCTQVTADIPLSWLWRHRTYWGQPSGIIHFYRPGALTLSQRQRQRLWFRLWLARNWGIPIVTSDTGGWWQTTRQLRHLTRRLLERKLLYSSDIVLASTRQPAQLYPDQKLRRHVRCLPHPGFHGYYAQPVERREAHRQLGLPSNSGYIYLCLAYAHTERELVHLLEIFTEVRGKEVLRVGASSSCGAGSQLLVVGVPGDKKGNARMLRLAALNAAVHLSMAQPGKEDIPLYLGAADALVLPHFALPAAGTSEIALLALSYGRAIVAPRLPRFKGVLPPGASVFYEPAQPDSLLQALLKLQGRTYALGKDELEALEAKTGWVEYAQRLQMLYKQLLLRS